MMYRCENCGNLFEEGEQAVWEEPHGLDSPPYENWSGCPVCKGDYEEVHQCKKCGEWKYDDELYNGWCEKCLRDTINYDTFFEYCEANKDEQYLDIFVMAYLLGDMSCPRNVSKEFHRLMIDTYKRMVAEEKLFGKADDILIACIRFIMDDDGYSGIENYADWLNKRGGK